MRQLDFPGYRQHKTEHDTFAIKVVDFQQEFHQGSLALTFEVMDFLERWLVNHIVGTDRKYSTFFNMKGLT